MEERYIYEYRCMAVTHEVVLIVYRIVEERDDKYIVINECGVQHTFGKPLRNYDVSLERKDKEIIKKMYQESQRFRMQYNNAQMMEIAKRNRWFDEEQENLAKVYNGEMEISVRKHVGEPSVIMKGAETSIAQNGER